VREVVVVSALGVTVGIEVGEDLAPEVRRGWSRAMVDAEPEVVVPVPEVYAGALSQLSSEVTLAAIERRAGSLWMLHAAGLADPETGRAVVLVGPSGSGKSTAARALGRRLGYLSDEAVGIDPAGRVVPHAKPLSVIVDGTYPKQQLSPDELGLAVAPADPSLRAVVLLHRDGTREAGLTAVRRAAALPLLAEHTSYLARLRRPLHVVAGILEGVDVHDAHYAETADLDPLVTRLLEDR